MAKRVAVLMVFGEGVTKERAGEIARSWTTVAAHPAEEPVVAGVVEFEPSCGDVFIDQFVD
jgi:hypothetical protein